MPITSLSGRAGSGKDLVASIIQYLTSECSNSGGNHYRTFDKWLDKGQGNNDFQPWYNSPWEIKKWAGVLRKITSIMLGVDEAYTYTDEFKASTLPSEWCYYEADRDENGDVIGQSAKSMTGRLFLQLLGTDAIRNGLHTNAWVNALMSGYPDKDTWFLKKTGYSRADFKVYNSIDYAEYNEDYFTECPKWIISDTRFPNELKAVKDKGGITIRINRNLPVADYKTLEQLHPSETALDDAEYDYVIDNNGTIQELEDKVRQILLKEGIIK